MPRSRRCCCWLSVKRLTVCGSLAVYNGTQALIDSMGTMQQTRASLSPRFMPAVTDAQLFERANLMENNVGTENEARWVESTRARLCNVLGITGQLADLTAEISCESEYAAPPAATGSVNRTRFCNARALRPPGQRSDPWRGAFCNESHQKVLRLRPGLVKWLTIRTNTPMLSLAVTRRSNWRQAPRGCCAARHRPRTITEQPKQLG